jgi:hypothetical protein
MYKMTDAERRSDDDVHGSKQKERYDELKNVSKCIHRLCMSLTLALLLFQAQGKSGGAFSISGMKSKLFGGDTPEQREAKLRQLEEQIVQAEAELKQTTEESQ